MDEEGVVVELKAADTSGPAAPGIAVVRMDGGGGCDSCSSAGICKGGSGDRLLDAENRAGASVGQRVVVAVDGGAFLKASLVVYMMPVVFLFAGAILGDRYGALIMPGMEPDFYQAVGGVLFLVLSLSGIRLYGWWTNKNHTVNPFVKRVVGGNTPTHGENDA